MALHYDDDTFYDFIQFGDGQFSDCKLLVEGDSWAAHPQLLNLTHCLDREENGRHAILSLAHSGDTAMEMFNKKSKQFRKFDLVVRSKEFGFKFNMVLLSAGGNDIVGPEIIKFLLDKETHPGKYGAELIDDAAFDGTLNDINGYFSNALNAISKSSKNKDIPVVAHTYSYLKPRRVGTHLGPLMFSEGWIARHMENDRHIDDEQEQIEIIKAMLTRFRDSLSQLQSKHSNFLVVDTLNVLSKNKQPDKSLFHDEIHPNRDGFQKVMKHIKSKAKKAGFWIN